MDFWLWARYYGNADSKTGGAEFRLDHPVSALGRDDERLAETLAGLYFVVFAILILVKAAPLLQSALRALILSPLPPRLASWPGL
jgi:hypothetical protein